MAESDIDNSGIHPDSGQVGAFLSLYLANQKRICAFILTLVPNWTDADDLMQETATVMWNKFGQFEPGSNFAAWGMKIARYRILKYFSKKSASKINFDDETLTLLEEDAPKVLEKNDVRLQALQECMSKLSQKDHSLLKMRYDEGFAVKSIAEKIARPVHYVYRALGRLHEMLLICVRSKLAE